MCVAMPRIFVNEDRTNKFGMLEAACYNVIITEIK